MRQTAFNELQEELRAQPSRDWCQFWCWGPMAEGCFLCTVTPGVWQTLALVAVMHLCHEGETHGPTPNITLRQCELCEDRVGHCQGQASLAWVLALG